MGCGILSAALRQPGRPGHSTGGHGSCSQATCRIGYTIVIMRESLHSVHFSRRILETPIPIEKPKTWQLNLSSNEMGHDACLKLAARFFQSVKAECVRSYPRYSAVSRLAAESAGLTV